VCSGVLRVLLAVLQTSGAAMSRWRTTGGSPSLQATWNEFQPSLFCSAGSAPRRSSSWTTPRFLRVQAIISGVLREEATNEIRCWQSKNKLTSINSEDSFRGGYRGLYLLLSHGLWRSRSRSMPTTNYSYILMCLCYSVTLSIWSHNIYSFVHPGEGSSSVALLKGSSLVSPVRGFYFYFLGVFPDLI